MDYIYGLIFAWGAPITCVNASFPSGNWPLFIPWFPVCLVMDVSAVLFDMDGTLVDSIPAWHRTFNQALGSQGGSPVSYEYFVSDILGQSTEADIARFFPKLKVDDLVHLYDMFFPQNLAAVKLFPSTLEVLDFLDARDIRKAVVTNTPRELMLMTLEKVGIADRFDVVVGGSDVSVGKPDPEMIHKCLGELGLSGDNVLLVGDTMSDVNAGLNSGVKTIGVGVDGDWKIRSLSQLIPLLESLL